jgi:hypothetical protein
VVTPAETVPGTIRECAAAGIQGAIIISAGFRESGARGVLCKRFNLSRHFNPPFLFREVTRLSC